MDDRSADAADLLGKMSVRILNGVCEFILANETPPDWRVRITQGGAKFFNEDKTDYTDGPHNLNIDSGQSYSFYSRDAGKCVSQIFLAITCNSPTDGDQTFTYTTPMAPVGKCRIRAGVALGKTSIVDQKDLQQQGITYLMELYEK